MAIDNIKDNGTFSCCVNKCRRAFTPGDNLVDVINFLNEQGLNVDHSEDIKLVTELWTEEIVQTFKVKAAEQELKEKMQQIEAVAKQELWKAEEQAHIENIIREVINVK